MDSAVWTEPEDFDEFWHEAKSEADHVKLNYWRSQVSEHQLPEHTIEVIRFESVRSLVLEGWIAIPKGIRKAPAFLWINPYGRESLLPNEYGTRPGFVSLNFNFFGLGAFHQEKYIRERGYFSEGARSPQTFIFRQMIQSCFIALRVLQAQLEVDEDRIAVMGMSQGAGLAIAAAAWVPFVRAVCADMPFWGNIRQSLSDDVYRYPMKELLDFEESIPAGRETVMHTMGFFDTCSQAKRVIQPTHVTLGRKDPACKPATVQAIYDALPGEKSLTELDWGHDWHPSMLETNLQWLTSHLTGL